MKDTIRISFLGDFCPINRVEKLILTNDFNNFNEIRNLLLDQDIVVVNIEGPLTTFNGKIKKNGPSIKNHPDSVNLLKYLNINVAALANNHILDYGQQGIQDTLNILHNNGIESLGAGKNLIEAGRPLEKTVSGTSIRIINVCEWEFNIAKKDHAGANPIDIPVLVQYLKDIDNKSDITILYYHGGFENYNLPTPTMFKNMRFFADLGIDIVICNHQHVFSGYEIYSRSYIYYGLGNFIFDWPSLRNNSWNYGLLLNIVIKNKKINNVKIIPFEQCNHEAGISIYNINSAKIENEIANINEKLTEEKITENWEEFKAQMTNAMLANLLIPNRCMRYLFKKTGIMKYIMPKKYVRKIYNYFNCQSYTELIRDILYNQMQ